MNLLSNITNLFLQTNVFFIKELYIFALQYKK